LKVCTACGVQMPDDAAFCPGCGRAMRAAQGTTAGGATAAASSDASAAEPVAPTMGKTGGLGDNIAGMLAYCTIFPAIIFLVLDPFNKNKFIRFHSFQSLLLWVAVAAVGIALKIVFVILFFIPFLGRFLWLVVSAILSVFWFIVWVVLIVKALQGEKFKLPVIGEWAERAAEN